MNVALADLTPPMQRVLIRATAHGIRPQEVGYDDEHSVHPATVHALGRRGLLHLTVNRRGRELWRPTATGRAMVSEHVPLLLHRRAHRNYTHIPAFAAWGEPEVMDAA
jgi:hypothetical protein